MQMPLHKAVSDMGRRVLVGVVSWVVLWIYAWQVISPPLFYSAYGSYIDYPIFSLDWRISSEVMFQPGGLAMYLGGMFAQFFYYGWAGALVISGVALLLCVGFERLIATAGPGGRIPWVVLLAPALGIVIIHNRYVMVLDLLVGLVLGVWASVILCWVAKKRPVAATVVSCLLVAPLWYAGGGAASVFALTVALYLGAVRRRYVLAVIPPVVLPVAIGLVGVQWIDLVVGKAFSVLTPFADKSLIADDVAKTTSMILFAWAPILIVGTVLVGRFSHEKEEVEPAKKAAGKGKKPRIGLFQRPGLRIVVDGLLVVVLAGAAGRYSPQALRKQLFRALYDAHTGDWTHCVDTIIRIPRGQYDFYCNHLANRALCHLGLLTDRMFVLPQGRPALLLLTQDVPNDKMKFSLLYESGMELGHLNLARHLGYEMLETQGPCARVLENLALIHVAKGQPKAARLLFNAMAGDIVHRQRALEYLAALDRDSWMKDDKRVSVMEANRWNWDCPYDGKDEAFILQGLLESNPKNQAAFEYLMAFYLLTKQLDKIMPELHRIKDLGYTRIPTHIEEAIMIHGSMTKQQVPLFGYQMSQQTVQRYNEFIGRFKQFEGNKKAAAVDLAPKYGNSYFFYYMFNSLGFSTTE